MNRLPSLLFLFIISIVGIVSCSPFTRVAKYTQISRGDSKGYDKIYNDSAGIKTFTFGDFEIAYNAKNYHQMHPKKAEFDHILFYAKTYDPEYDYYVLLNPETKILPNEKYLVKDTMIANSHFLIVISTKAPKPDVDFILKEIYPN